MASVAERKAVRERKERMTLQHNGWARGHTRDLDIRSGDTVEVISGRDRGKRGVVERVDREKLRLTVRGINVLKRHTRSGVKENVQGGIIDFNGPVRYSNVMLVCNRCDKATRIAHGIGPDGSRTIVCKRCGEHYERTAQ